MIDRVAVLADIHGVLPALEAVLAEPDVRAADAVVVCGDVAAGPQPAETMSALTGALGPRALWLRGNADRALVEVARGSANAGAVAAHTAWAAGQLSHDQIETLAALPTTLHLDVADLGATVFCHGSPRGDDDIVLVDSAITLWSTVLDELSEAVQTVVCAHTHMPFVRLVDRRTVLNPGSVGMPYGARGACWALLGRGVGISLRRSAFDVDDACERIASSSSYPELDDWLERYMRRPPSDLEALRVFTPLAGG